MTNLPWKRPESKSFWHCRLYHFYSNYSILLYHESSHKKIHKQMSVVVFNTISFLDIDIWFSDEFHVSWILILFFFQWFENVKIILSLEAIQKQVVGCIWAHGLPMPEIKDCLALQYNIQNIELKSYNFQNLFWIFIC